MKKRGDKQESDFLSLNNLECAQCSFLAFVFRTEKHDAGGRDH